MELDDRLIAPTPAERCGRCRKPGLVALGAGLLAGGVALIVLIVASPGPGGDPRPWPPPAPAPEPVRETYARRVCTVDLYASAERRRFSVWAPHAATVFVVPEGAAAWARAPLVRQGDFWTAEVPGVQPGDAYVFEVEGRRRIDPCALDISPDGLTSVVSPPYEWRNPRRVVPRSQAIIYEMHIGSFTEEGTFDAAVRRLDYLAELGVTVLELMPVMYFCGDPRSWGYNPCAPFAVKPEFGGSLGLRRFVDAAAGRGLAVVLDTVFNHLASDNRLLGYDGPSGENGIYFYSGSKAYVYGFDKWGPRPAFDDDTVLHYIADSYATWIDEFHIAGFRWDAAMCVRRGVGREVCFDGEPTETDLPSGWRAMQLGNNASHGGLRAGTLTFAEEMGYADVTKPTQDASAGPREAPGGAGFDAQWILHPELQWQFQLPDPSKMRVDMMIGQCALMRMNQVVSSETHDSASRQNTQPGRIPGMVQRTGASPYWTQKAVFLYFGLVMTCPAIPLLLQEQEAFSFADFSFPNPPPFNWSLPEANAGLLQESKDLIALRGNAQGVSAGLQGSGVRILLIHGLAAAMLRWAEDGAPGHTIVVYNMATTALESFAFGGVPVDGTWIVRFNGDARKYSPLYGDSCASQVSVQVRGGKAVVCAPAASLLVLSLDAESRRRASGQPVVA